MGAKETERERSEERSRTTSACIRWRGAHEERPLAICEIPLLTRTRVITLTCAHYRMPQAAGEPTYYSYELLALVVTDSKVQVATPPPRHLHSLYCTSVQNTERNTSMSTFILECAIPRKPARTVHILVHVTVYIKHITLKQSLGLHNFSERVRHGNWRTSCECSAKRRGAELRVLVVITTNYVYVYNLTDRVYCVGSTLQPEEFSSRGREHSRNR